MIPSVDDVAAAAPFIARRFGIDALFPIVGVRAALEEASTLGAGGRDEAAAVFFAFARRGRALGGWWRVLSDLLTLQVARAASGAPLRATADELAGLRLDVATRRANFDDVRRWFAERS